MSLKPNCMLKLDKVEPGLERLHDCTQLRGNQYYYSYSQWVPSNSYYIICSVECVFLLFVCIKNRMWTCVSVYLVKWRTCCIVLLMFASIGEPMPSRSAQPRYYRQKCFTCVYSSFIYVCRKNCVCMRVAPPGWVAYIISIWWCHSFHFDNHVVSVCHIRTARNILYAKYLVS